nr:hypothetical protein [Tanacetum cinerariifolium]
MEGPQQESDIHQLIEECSTEICEEQRQSIEDTMLELVKICQEKELLCIHDNVNDLIESSCKTKLLSINSQRLDKKEQEVKNVIEQPVERGNRSIQSLQNFRVVHKNSISLNNTSQISSIHAVATILSTKELEYSLIDEIIKSGVEELIPILNEIEVTSENESKCDVPISENSSICDDHSDIFSDSKNNDDISVYNDILKISKSDNSLLDNFLLEFETFCDYTEETRSGNTTRADNSLPEYDSFCFEIEPDQERLINVLKTNISDDSNDPLLEEADLFLASDNSIPPGIENVADDSEEYVHFLEELLIDDFILSHESSDSYFKDNPSIPLPPPEPPEEELDFEIDFRDEILVERNIIVEFDFDARVKLDVFNNENDDLSYFMFVMFDKVFSFISAESEDTIFDPGISI